MTERRSGTDRRAQPRDTEDRRHGLRTTYQKGCGCTPCRAANADYTATLRARYAHQQPILGSHRDARTTWRQIRALRIEGFSKAEIARRLGLRRPRLRLHPERVTLRSALLVSRLYRSMMGEPVSDSSDLFDSDPNAKRRDAPERRSQEGQ